MIQETSLYQRLAELVLLMRPGKEQATCSRKGKYGACDSLCSAGMAYRALFALVHAEPGLRAVDAAHDAAVSGGSTTMEQADAQADAYVRLFRMRRTVKAAMGERKGTRAVTMLDCFCRLGKSLRKAEQQAGLSKGEGPGILCEGLIALAS